VRFTQQAQVAQHSSIAWRTHIYADIQDTSVPPGRYKAAELQHVQANLARPHRRCLAVGRSSARRTRPSSVPTDAGSDRTRLSAWCLLATSSAEKSRHTSHPPAPCTIPVCSAVVSCLTLHNFCMLCVSVEHVC